MSNTTLKIGGKEIAWHKLFLCAQENGFIPSPIFWQAWREFKTDFLALGFAVVKTGKDWIVTSEHIQP